MKTDLRTKPLLPTSYDCELERLRLLDLRRPRRRVAAVARLERWLEAQEAERFAEALAGERRSRARMAMAETAMTEAW